MFDRRRRRAERLRDDRVVARNVCRAKIRERLAGRLPQVEAGQVDTFERRPDRMTIGVDDERATALPGRDRIRSRKTAIVTHALGVGHEQPLSVGGKYDRRRIPARRYQPEPMRTNGIRDVEDGDRVDAGERDVQPLLRFGERERDRLSAKRSLVEESEFGAADNARQPAAEPDRCNAIDVGHGYKRIRFLFHHRDGRGMSAADVV